jgi:MoaA/NifB/PqqE/SkfB family radical SAM enzyme
MTQVEIFTSTGKKLLRQAGLLAKWRNHLPIPHSLQVAPTEVCNLNCEFCSVKNRSRKYVFEPSDLIAATASFIKLGTKTVEITGGGEPLCYHGLNKYIAYLVWAGVKIGLITNGLGINEIIPEYQEKFSWIRISANVYDYKKRIDIPKNFPGTLGFSYVWTDGISSFETLMAIKKIAEDNKVEYIRLVPNCLGTKDQQIVKNSFLQQIADNIGPPVFFQKKVFGTPRECYWGYLKPFLYPDGYVYPCSSVVLNTNANEQFHESYRLCHWKDVENFWTKVHTTMSLIDTKLCDHCVFTEQNEILDYVLHQQKHEDFI